MTERLTSRKFNGRGSKLNSNKKFDLEWDLNFIGLRKKVEKFDN